MKLNRPQLSSLIGQRRGATLVGTLIGAVVVLLSAKAFASVLSSAKHLEKSNRDRAYVQMHLAELIETFRSLGSGTFYNQYYRRLPQAYPLCSHINLIDRTNIPGNIINPDPNVELAPNFLLQGTSAGRRPNRFYQVQIINIQTLAINTAPCMTGAPPYVYDPGGNERFTITVGISWTDPKQADANREVLTTVLYQP